MRKKYFLISLGAICLILSVISVWFLIINHSLKEKIARMKRLEDSSLRSYISQEKDKIKQDLDEKYRADIISFKAMKRRVELQKEKIRELEEKIKEKEEE